MDTAQAWKIVTDAALSATMPARNAAALFAALEHLQPIVTKDLDGDASGT